MRNSFSLLGAVLLTGLLAAGCAGPEQKLGRGFSNMFEIVRLGEMRRSIEQAGLFDSPGAAYTTGLVRGFDRTLARMGVGVYEVATFPIPSYDPVCTSYLTPVPPYPDTYKPGVLDDASFATDTTVGFSGGDIAPMVPGSRFRVFDN